MVYEVQDKVFFVTGAASGIGAATVRILVAEGVKHVALLDVSEDRGINLQEELNSKFGANKAKFYKCDVTNEEQLINAYDSVKEEQEYIDVVINNAGIMNDSLATYRKEIQINLTALVSSTFKAIELMRKDEGGKGGAIFNVSSIAALHSSPVFPVYFATKSAVLQFGNCLSSDKYYDVTGVRILTICFGVTDTALYENMNCYDKYFHEHWNVMESFKKYPWQKVDAAAKALVEAYKGGENGNIWLSTSGKPVRDITHIVKKAYEMLTELVFEQ